MESPSAILDSTVKEGKNNDNDMLNSLLITAQQQIQSDWKSKSLDPKPIEKYQIELKQDFSQEQEIETEEKPSLLKRMFGKKQQKKQAVSKTQRNLPQPKIAKINDRIFCMAIESDVKIYFYNKDPKIKRMFDMIDYSVSEPIEFVFGNNTDYVFIGHKHKLTVLQLQRKQGKIKYEIVKVQHKKINNLKRCTHHGKYLYALSSDEVYEFQIDSNILVQRKLSFNSPEQQKMFDQLQPIQLVTQNQRTLFFFGTKRDERTLVDMKSNNLSPDARKKECECLTLVRFNLDKTSKILSDLGIQKKTTPGENKQENSIQVTLFPIDHVFDTGIFMKSKVFVLENEMFLMELYEEVILIKKHFQKYIVWDNISILSSKSSQKKGQLVLADKRIMVYSEIGQIYAYDIYFNNEQSKLNMPAIDSFKGNQNDDEVLYDAVLLRYSAKTLMKVLFYFKEFDIARPKFRINYGGDQKKDGKINLSIISIVQSDPKQKLLDLLALKKPANQIQQFVKRFKISELEKYKSQWTVSKKTIKDIENNLLQIEDDKYIQEELDKILKDKPHDLNFLTIVEKKQIERLKRLLVRNLLKINKNDQKELQSEVQIKEAEKTETRQVEYINQVIQWLMESMMFLKKLSYSKNFLSFKQYDFIQIGKLKAASLKQQIKLLTCKKFEKRLKYFLNSFKFLAIANYQDIFTFLLQNKSEQELQEFILSFKFIMPNFTETSEVFIRKIRNMGETMLHSPANLNIQIANRQSIVIGGEGNQQNQQACELWQQNKEQTSNQMAQTLLSSAQGQSKAPRVAQSFSNIENFQKMIMEEIQLANIDSNIDSQRVREQAADNFRKILSKFIDSNWFRNSAFKQHATLSISTKQLYEKFYQLKNEGVFNLFTKIVYRKIREGVYTERKVQSILDCFVHHKILPESYRKNVQSRVQVYKIIENQNAAKSSSNPFLSMAYRRDLNLREDFLIMREDYYFEYLLIEYRSLVLKDIKDAYQRIQPNFFRERFQIFLNSQIINLKQIIGFMDEFVANPDDKIRLDVFKCIKSHLKLNDYQNAKKFNQKSLDKSVFPEQRLQLDQLKQQAKIPYGFYFYSFWNALALELTYQDLIQATHCPILDKNKFIKTIIQKYSRGEYAIDANNSTLITFIDGLSLDKAQPIDINENPLGFFGLLLYILDTLSFKVETVSVFNFLVESYLNNNSFATLKKFVQNFAEFEIDQCNLPTRNFELIADFKQQNFINKILADKVIQWIQNSYKEVNSLDQITSSFSNIDQAIALINQFSREAVIEREKAFLEMLKLIRKFDEKILLDIDYLRTELNQTGFTFMMHLIGKGNLSILENQSAQVIEDQIYNFYCIYSCFKQASKGQIVDSMQSNQLCKFFNELCHKLIKCKYYLPAQRILFKAVGSSVYFRDIVFAFLAEMQYIPSQDRKEFIRDFLQTQTTSLLKKKVTQITEKVNGFEKDPAYFKSSANGVFKDILENHKPAQAFFFLIRLPELHLMQSASEINEVQSYRKTDMSSYLLLTAYIRCLQQHLSIQFYPSFQFFKSKLEMLHAQMDRMDVVKDVNIAISRLKDISNEQFESEQKKFNVSKDQSELQFFYKRFMESIGMNPQVRLTQEEFLQASKRIERYSRHIPQEILVKKAQEEADTRIDLKNNQQKLSKVRRQNKAEVIEKEVAATITEAKKTAEKYSKMIGQRTPISKKNIAQRTQEEMSQIRKRQQCQIQSVKESFKSSTTERVNNLIDSLRKKRNNAVADSRVSEFQKAPISEMRTPQRTQSYPIEMGSSKTPVQPYKKQEESTKSRKKDLESSRALRQKQLEIQRIQREKAEKRQKQTANKAPDAIFSLIGLAKKNPGAAQTKGPERLDSIPNTISNESMNTRFSGQSQYAIKVTSPYNSVRKMPNKEDENFLPVTIIGKMVNDPSITMYRKGEKKQQWGESQNSSSISDNLSDLRKRIESRKQQQKGSNSGSSKKKITYKELQKLFNQKEVEAAKYLPKIELIKQNMKVGSQLIKRVFSVCQNFENFFKLIEYMVGSDSKFKEIIEQKSLIIVNQMQKMKGNISLKQILPVQLFITLNRSNIKDYYSFAFEMILPNVIKVLEKPDANIHGLAVMIRYGFGAQNSVYYQVYEEYIRVLLKDYQISKPDDRKTFLLAQKMKNIYPNMNPDNRQGKFIQIIQDMRDRQKKEKLVKSLHGALTKRSDVSGQGNEEFSHTVTELIRKVKI